MKDKKTIIEIIRKVEQEVMFKYLKSKDIHKNFYYDGSMEVLDKIWRRIESNKLHT